MNNLYVISEEEIRASVIKATKELFRHHKGWDRDNNLTDIKFTIDKGIRTALNEVNCIKLIK